VTDISENNSTIPDILVMGIGNFLMGDEGVGVHFIKNYERDLLDLGVEPVDGGTGGFHLMSYFEAHRKVLLIDATIDGKAPGTISRLKPKFSSDFPQALSAHDIGLKDLIDALILSDKLPEIYLFTVSITEIQNMVTELSYELVQSLPILYDLVHSQIRDIQKAPGP
jgi:hydrogenase maturation protease